MVSQINMNLFSIFKYSSHLRDVRGLSTTYSAHSLVFFPSFCLTDLAVSRAIQSHSKRIHLLNMSQATFISMSLTLSQREFVKAAYMVDV